MQNSKTDYAFRAAVVTANSFIITFSAKNLDTPSDAC